MPYQSQGDLPQGDQEDAMARSYRRNARGRFAGVNRKGSLTTTVAQDRAAHARERTATRKALSGTQGASKSTKANRNRTVGKAATNRRVKAALAAARRRLS
jgi:hypothetical protein